MHAEEDRRKRPWWRPETTADALIYSTEKSIKELGDKVDESPNPRIETALNPLKRPWKVKTQPRSNG
jgi:molecular chaperone DnaK